MNTKKISVWLYYVNAIIAIGFGALYFFKNNMMDYHYAFMEMDAAQINDFNSRILILMEALKKIVGAGLIGIGIGAFTITHFALRDQDNKGANVLAFLTLMIPNTTLLLISHYVAGQITSGPKPPWMLSVLALVLIIIAFILYFIPSKKK